jgi:hypothetical protein
MSGASSWPTAARRTPTSLSAISRLTGSLSTWTERASRLSSPATSDLRAERVRGNVAGGKLQLVTGQLAQGLWGVQLARIGALENRRQPIGRLVEDLGDLQDLLNASHEITIA